MPVTINDLRTRATLIADATQVGENTANRVGTAFDIVADLLDQISGNGFSLPSVEISDIDTFSNYSDKTDATPSFWNVTKHLGGGYRRVGAMACFYNQGLFILYQVLLTDFEISGGILDPNSSFNGEMKLVWRMYQTSGNPPAGYNLNEWTHWEALSGGGSTIIDNDPTQNSTNAVSSGGVYSALQDIALRNIDVDDLDTLNQYTNMTADVPTFYNVTQTISGNDFRVGSLIEYCNLGRYVLYQVLSTDYLIEDGVLNTSVGETGVPKLVWRMYQFSGNPPAGVVLNQWSKWTSLGGSNITIDATPTDGSNNAVSSNGVYDALALKQDTISIDATPTNGSSNPVSSDGVYDALATKQDTLTFDATPTNGSTKPVESNGIYDALAAKQNTLSFDATPTDTSTNPVTSDGIYQYFISQLSQYIPATNFATINGSSITQGGNVQIVSVEGTITIDAAPTSGSSNCASSGGIYDAIEGGFYV